MRRLIWVLCIILGIPRFKVFFTTSTAFPCGIDCQKVSFYSRRCGKVVLLSGRYFTSPGSDKCIIITQGYGKHLGCLEDGVLEIIKFLVKQGFNILIFDLRAHGESGGRRTSLGYYETYDLLGAFDFLVDQRKIVPQKIGLMGFSIGAMISILVAGRANIAAAVVDSCPGDVEGFAEKIVGKLRFPFFIFTATHWFTSSFFGINIDDLNTEEATKRISCPVFFIYGKKDISLFTSVEEWGLVKKKHPLDKIWAVDSTHTKSFKACPEQYLKEIVEFFDKAI